MIFEGEYKENTKYKGKFYKNGILEFYGEFKDDKNGMEMDMIKMEK